WDEQKQRAQVRRWGGAIDGDRAQLDNEILADIPVTFLQALRDSNQALQPGNKNRLARLLEQRTKADAEKQKGIRAIFEKANAGLDEHELVKELAQQLRYNTKQTSGSDFVDFNVRASDPDYQRILRTLRIVLKEDLPDITSTGLGYS